MGVFAQGEESKLAGTATAAGGGLRKMATAIVSKGTQLLASAPSDKRALNPARELSGSKLSAVKEFLTLFRLKREELRVEVQRLAEALSQNNDNYGGNVLPEK